MTILKKSLVTLVLLLDGVMNMLYILDVEVINVCLPRFFDGEVESSQATSDLAKVSRVVEDQVIHDQRYFCGVTFRQIMHKNLPPSSH